MNSVLKITFLVVFFVAFASSQALLAKEQGRRLGGPNKVDPDNFDDWRERIVKALKENGDKVTLIGKDSNGPLDGHIHRYGDINDLWTQVVNGIRVFGEMDVKWSPKGSNKHGNGFVTFDFVIPPGGGDPKIEFIHLTAFD